MKTQKPIFTPENPPRYGDLWDLLAEAFPIVEETEANPYKPGYVNDLIRRMRSALESAPVK